MNLLLEINVAVAEHIFGWKWVRAKECEWFTKDYNGKTSLCAHMLRQGAAWMTKPDSDMDLLTECDGSGMNVYSDGFKGKPGVYVGWGRAPAYSTDIALAWEVARTVRDMRWTEGPFAERGGMTDVSLLYNPYECTWKCTFNWSSDSPESAEHQNAETAICLAALKAVGKPFDLEAKVVT